MRRPVARTGMPIAGVALWALIAGPATVQAADLVSFNTPSKNIYCMAYHADSGAPEMTVECEIRTIARSTLKIARPKNCDLDWGRRFAVRQRGRPWLTCYGDTLISDDSRTIAYGKTQTFDGISCSSSQKGLRCVNPSGHGFILSRSLQQMF